MNHGGDPSNILQAAPPPSVGPRPPLQLGLDAARATQNILRLLEASHGAYYSGAHDTLATVWHPEGLVWFQQQPEDAAGLDGGD